MPGLLSNFLDEACRMTASAFRAAYPFPFLLPIGFRESEELPSGAQQTMIVRATGPRASPLLGPHPLAGVVLSLTAADGNGGRVRIGRASDNDLVLPDPAISTHHCEFAATEFGVLVTDLRSTNGTLVNDERVDPEHPVPVEDEDIVTFGRYRFQMLESLSFHRALREMAGMADEPA